MLATLAVLTMTSPLFAPVALAQGNNSLSLIAQRRINDLAQFPNPLWFADISTWLATQKEDGTWADVNYLSGCAAREYSSYYLPSRFRLAHCAPPFPPLFWLLLLSPSSGGIITCHTNQLFDMRFLSYDGRLSTDALST
jgi:hypothetical protein